MSDRSENFPIEWALIAESARLSSGLSEEQLTTICAATLRGKTQREPSISDCVHSITLRGFFYEDGVAWGLYFNEAKKRNELVRLAD